MFIAKMPDGTPEIYPAFQGEGQTLGAHCIFIRLYGCNLMCNFCDTSYTWFTEDRKDLPDDMHRYSKKVKKEDYMLSMTNEEVASYILSALPDEGEVNIIFSGGEPLLQQKQILEVIKILKETEKYMRFEIETNGGVVINKDLVENLDFINCSPKLASSGNPKDLRDNKKAIEALMEIWSADVAFKFVVHPEKIDEDMAEIVEWAKRHKVPKGKIYLMPEGITAKRIVEGSDKIWRYAYDKGYKFTSRLHVLLYGTKRAV